MRVGGNQIINVDVRIVAATNESLEQRVEEGSFRRDLYYRLNALPVLIPPLREREGDIQLLVEHFRQRTGGIFRLSQEVENLMLRYRWPGNIRELQNVVEYLSFTGQKIIEKEDLPPTFTRLALQEQSAASQPEPGMSGILQSASARRTQEFWFVLGQLYMASEREALIGREAILEAARQSHFPLSQKEVRDLLALMAQEGIAKVGRGRGGSRITPQGRKIWELRP